MNSSPLYLGIDLGTGGVRALVVSAAGELIAAASVAFPKSDRILPAGHHEQDAQQWWRTTEQTMAMVVSSMREKGFSTDAITSLSIDGTSGTVVGVDAKGEPVGPALMYNDSRAAAEARELAGAAASQAPSPSGQIAASYAIAKVRWLEKHEAARFQRARWFIHQADYIVGRLTGQWSVTDYSSALKTGYDLLANDWPAWLNGFPAIRERLPRVVAPGALLGAISASAVAQLRLSRTTRVIAGATDGTAGFLASGAHDIGHTNTTLGTTLVFKQLAARPVIDPAGLIYCHKLPGAAGDLWLPGAASNTGCEWMAKRFAGGDFKALDRDANSHFPCRILAYPLARTGERFPFLSDSAAGFCETAASPILEYAAHLQGVALVERLCYDTLDTACGHAPTSAPPPIFATGGGSHSDLWMQLRADVTGRVYHRPACPESAFGAAVLAAATDHADLAAAVRAMVRIEHTFAPDQAKRDEYDAIYHAFKHSLRSRGHLPPV